jgi:predicted dehydrogenase
VLIRDVEERRLIANVSCNLRFHEPIRAIKDLVAKEAVGRILTGIVEIGEWLPDWHPWEPYTDYYPSRRARGGGLDAICDLDWLIDVFGPVSRAVAFAGKHSSLDIDTDDVVQILLDFGSGMQVILHSDMIQRPYTHRAKFVGEGGTITWESGEQRVGIYRADAARWEYAGEARIDPGIAAHKTGFEWVEAMYREDTRYFLRCLAGEAHPLNTLRSNGEALAVILGALEAGRKGRIWCATRKE